MEVFIVRDVEERFIKGVYFTYAAAEQGILDRLDDGGFEGEDRELLKDDYEIVEQTVEGPLP